MFRIVWLKLQSPVKSDYRQDMLRYWAQFAPPPLGRMILEFETQLIGGYDQASRTFSFNVECAELALHTGQLGNLIAHELAAR
jgi:hypothetical protein